MIGSSILLESATMVSFVEVADEGRLKLQGASYVRTR